MVVGPPDSGKSVFSHRLFQTLLSSYPNIYLQRANWDGEGNYTLELPPDLDPEVFKAANKGQLTDSFFSLPFWSNFVITSAKRLNNCGCGGNGAAGETADFRGL